MFLKRNENFLVEYGDKRRLSQEKQYEASNDAFNAERTEYLNHSYKYTSKVFTSWGIDRKSREELNDLQILKSY